jgi:hypothetical protein
MDGISNDCIQQHENISVWTDSPYIMKFRFTDFYSGENILGLACRPNANIYPKSPPNEHVQTNV